MNRPIFTSLSPNTEKDDILLALKLIFQPQKWKVKSQKSKVKNFEDEFKNYLGVKHAIAFNSGRSAFLAILNTLNLKKESEVLLQAFTCNAAVNPILWSGLKPVFVDIEKETLNIDPADLERKITPKSKVVLVQHTFGLPANLDEILKICEKYNLILIEDCAHSLGAEYKGRKVGTFGKAAFFSFGRDKVISSIYGGMAVTNDDVLAQKIRDFQEKLSFPSNFWIFQQLLHPLLTNYLIIPLYAFSFQFGRLILGAFHKLKILSKAVQKKEKEGKKPKYIPKRMPNALAMLALNQFKKLEKFISHQREIAKFYDKSLSAAAPAARQPLFRPGRIYMRYSLLIENQNPDKILKKARRQKIFLDDGWRKTPIVPPDTNQAKMGYVLGSCPQAEKVAKHILNLPTHINVSKKDAQKITKFLKSRIFHDRRNCGINGIEEQNKKSRI